MILGRVAVVAWLAVASWTSLMAQGADRPAIDSAVTDWLELVSRGAGGAAWQGAGAYFQHRIDQRHWADWVTAQRPQLGGLRARRLMAVASGRDQAPLPELEWIVATFESARPAGGRMLERVWAWREDGGPYRVVNYGIWPDPEAVIHNAYVDPIPYRMAWGGSLAWYAWGWRGVRPARSQTEPAAPRGTAVANPGTFPRRPPERR